MIVDDRRMYGGVVFKSLNAGNVFDYKSAICIKTDNMQDEYGDPVNAICIVDGTCTHVEDDLIVEFVKAKVVIE